MLVHDNFAWHSSEGTPNGTRLEKQRAHMVAPISSISAVFISLPSLYFTIAPGAALINLAVQIACPSSRVGLR